MTKPQEEWIETQAETLRNKIKTIEGDYTFRKTDAEKLYREERTKLDAAQLSARLNGTTLESSIPQFPSAIATPASSDEVSPSVANTTSSSPTSPSIVNGSTTNGGAEAGGEANEEGGFFGNLLEEMPTEETTEQGTTIPIRNLSLPKHFSGKTPKVSLEETVRKLDKPASVKFNNHNRGSRAVRASVTIRWSDHRVQEWDMKEIACWDQGQAYNYIATIALFAIAGSTAVNKQLPTVFRDLWDELVAKKKEEDEEEYMEKLKLYRSIAEPRMQEQGSKVRLLLPILSVLPFSALIRCAVDL
jgi:ATP-dependent RNA helicase DHX29